jgi:putative acetyltransferase
MSSAVVDGLVVRRERGRDAPAVAAVVAAAFGDEQPEVPALWAALRAREGSVGLVAERDGVVVGHAGLSWSWLDAEERLVDVLVLSPVSVDPSVQGLGIGTALVAEACAEAERHGSPALFLEGDPAYYSTRGFAPATPRGFVAPSPRVPGPAFQVHLTPRHEPWMAGQLVYADTFWAFDCVGLRGERLRAVRAAIGE